MSVSELTGKRADNVSANFDLIDIADIQRAYTGHHYIFGHDGAIGQVFELTPINEAHLYEKDYVRIFEELSKTIMATAEVDISVCFHVLKTSNVEIPSVPEDFPLVVRERNAFAKRLAKDGELFAVKFYMSIRCLFDESMLPLGDKIKVVTAKAKSFVTGQTTVEAAKIKSTGVKERINKVAKSAQSLQSTLGTLGIKVRPLNSREEYERMFTYYLRPNTGRAGNIAPTKENDPINSFRQQLMSGITVREMPEYFDHDQYITQAYEFDRINTNVDVFSKDIQNLIAYPMEFCYTIAMSGMNHHKANALFQKALRRAKTQVDLKTNQSGECTDLSVMYEYKRLAQAYDRISQQANGAIQYSVTFIPRIRKSQVKKIMKQNAYDVIDDFLFNFATELRQNVFGNLGRSEWSVVEQGQWDVFCSTLPGLCGINGRSLKVSIDTPENLPFLIPLYTQVRQGIEHFGFNHFFTNAMNIYPFMNLDPDQPSWAALVAGDMGFGKSLTMNVYMANAFTALAVSGQRPIIRIIEFGGAQSSYFKQVIAQGGQILKFNGSNLPRFQILELTPALSYPKKSKMHKIKNEIQKLIPDLSDMEALEKITAYYDMVMNPETELNDNYLDKICEEIFGQSRKTIVPIMTLKDGECKPSPSKMNTIMSILEIMLSSDPKNLNAFSTDFSRDDIELFLSSLYERTDDRSPKLGELVEYIREYNKKAKNSNIDLLARRLDKWTVENGQYKMFDMPTSVSMDNDVIMFDLFGLDENPQLEAIYLTIITDALTRDMYEKQGRLRMCILDEVWKIAKTKAMQEVIIGFFRLSRKYKFQPIMASQFLSDYHGVSPEFGKVIVAQAKTFIVCGVVSEENINETVRLIGLPPEYKKVIQSLGLKKKENSKNINVYSRFLYVSVDKGAKIRPAVLNSILSPVEFELMNSNAEDNAITKYYLYEKGFTVEEAIMKVVNGEHKGDEALIEFLRKGNFIEAMKKCQKG
jgi:predicted transcriptional regulator